ncbi:hypothetical protein DSM104635_00153 [Terricaulis silvestris]|uniref:Uncharacterized protein n=1 Tax=Terricaulis silvestris TaxID=2686094 RepID=A0A6I6MQA5_9CAUL|nr:hypothetical protein DSM104635_00153 [Terricaulis silvestris]
MFNHGSAANTTPSQGRWLSAIDLEPACSQEQKVRSPDAADQKREHNRTGAHDQYDDG